VAASEQVERPEWQISVHMRAARGTTLIRQRAPRASVGGEDDACRQLGVVLGSLLDEDRDDLGRHWDRFGLSDTGRARVPHGVVGQPLPADGGLEHAPQDDVRLMDVLYE
jgi:hypothetical protein